MNNSEQCYSEKGVVLSGSRLYAGEKVTVAYSGLLAEAGADRVFIHYGYGEGWENGDLAEMEGSQGRFGTEIEIKGRDSLNLCFKDSADNWDNNSGDNYVFGILSRKKTGRTRQGCAKLQVEG